MMMDKEDLEELGIELPDGVDAYDEVRDAKELASFCENYIGTRLDPEVFGGSNAGYQEWEDDFSFEGIEMHYRGGFTTDLKGVITGIDPIISELLVGDDVSGDFTIRAENDLAYDALQSDLDSWRYAEDEDEEDEDDEE